MKRIIRNQFSCVDEVWKRKSLNQEIEAEKRISKHQRHFRLNQTEKSTLAQLAIKEGHNNVLEHFVPNYNQWEIYARR